MTVYQEKNSVFIVFEAYPMLHLRVRRASFSLFPLVCSCSNDYFCAYAVVDFLANKLVFPNMVTYCVRLYYFIFLFRI